MFSLPQIYGIVTSEEMIELDRTYKPLALSIQALNAAFREAATLRDNLFSDSALDWSTQLFQYRAGELEGMEKAFVILGVMEEYFNYLR